MATPKKTESEKKKGGRPPKKLTQEQIVQVEALAAYLTVEQIADYLSVGITTFYEIMERQPEVSERYKKGKSKAIGVVAKSLMKNIQEGKEASIIFFLKTKGGWTETQKLEHTGKDGEPIQHQTTDLSTLTDEQLARLETIAIAGNAKGDKDREV